METVIHVESFRNIDLYYQGLYFLKVSLFNTKNEEVSVFEKIISEIYGASLYDFNFSSDERESTENDLAGSPPLDSGPDLG